MGRVEDRLQAELEEPRAWVGQLGPRSDDRAPAYTVSTGGAKGLLAKGQPGDAEGDQGDDERDDFDIRLVRHGGTLQ